MEELVAREPMDTPEKIEAEMRRLLADLPEWERPVAHGVVLVPAGEEVARFPVVNVGAHSFPALGISTVTGHLGGSDTYELSRADLQAATDIVAPAEAATMYQHPNLRSWRDILSRTEDEDGSRIFAVFIHSMEDPVSSHHDKMLRDQIASGEKAELYS